MSVASATELGLGVTFCRKWYVSIEFRKHQGAYNCVGLAVVDDGNECSAVGVDGL